MALDRFVRFNKTRKPTKAKLKLVVEDYFRGLATKIEWNQDRWQVTLPGPSTHPLERLEKGLHMSFWKIDGHRYIEVVWLDREMIDVITRLGDEVTNVLAAGFATLCVRYWDGELEDPS